MCEKEKRAALSSPYKLKSLTGVFPTGIAGVSTGIPAAEEKSKGVVSLLGEI